jgi:hypothetical protein
MAILVPQANLERMLSVQRRCLDLKEAWEKLARPESNYFNFTCVKSSYLQTRSAWITCVSFLKLINLI